MSAISGLLVSSLSRGEIDLTSRTARVEVVVVPQERVALGGLPAEVENDGDVVGVRLEDQRLQLRDRAQRGPQQARGVGGLVCV